MNPFARFPLVAPTFVTVTVTAPALPAGVFAVTCVPLTTTTLVAALLPNFTVAPVEKFVPVIMTAEPPAVDPLFGATLPTVGGVASAESDHLHDPRCRRTHRRGRAIAATAVTILSSAISPSGVVSSRLMKPPPGPLVRV